MKRVFLVGLISLAAIASQGQNPRTELPPAAEREIQTARQERETMESVFGPRHTQTWLATTRLAMALGKYGKFAEAQTLARRASEGLEKNEGPDHISTLETLGVVALALKGLNREAEAEPVLRTLLARYERLRGPNDLETLFHANVLANCLTRQGKNEEAVPLLQRVIQNLKPANERGHVTVVNCLIALGKIEIERNDLKGAMEHAREAAVRSEKNLGPSYGFTLDAKVFLATTLAESGEREEATRIARDVVSLTKNNPKDPRNIAALDLLKRMKK